MDWIVYLLKVSACMAFFYLLYQTCFRKLTFFSLNRIYLLSAIVMSFFIPLLQIDMERTLPYQHIKQNVVANTDLSLSKIEKLTHSETSPDNNDRNQPVNLAHIVTTSYWIGVFVSLIIFIIQMASLLKYAFSKKQSIGRLKLISKSKGFTNCSFFHYVFIDEQNLSPEESQAILAHETIHATKYHSLDNLLLSACKVLLWFNPFVYLYSKCLAQVHEFQADLGTSKTIGNSLYAQMLLRFAIQTDRLTIAHHFNENPIKDRIKMLFTNSSNSMKKLLYFVTAPVCCVLLFSFSVKHVDKFEADVKVKPAKYKLEKLQINAEDELVRKLKGKTIAGTVLSDYTSRGFVHEERVLFLSEGTMYIIDLVYNKPTSKLLHVNDKISIQINGVSSPNPQKGLPYVSLTAKHITREGSTIFIDKRIEPGITRMEMKNVSFKNPNVSFSYTVRDSTKVNEDLGLVYLYGAAEIKKEGFSIKADKFLIDYKTGIVKANNIDSIGVHGQDQTGVWKAGRATFSLNDQMYKMTATNDF
jgi:hypothetical protein